MASATPHYGAAALAVAAVFAGHSAGAQQYNVTDLGSLGGAATTAAGINASGEITGSSTVVAGGPTHAFLYSDGSMTDLGTLGGTSSVGTGINNSGEVTGYSYSSLSEPRNQAFVCANGAMSGVLSANEGQSFGPAVNASGTVTGSISPDEGSSLIFIANAGSLTILTPSPGQYSAGEGINDAGQVTGFFDSATGQHAFLYSSGALTDLGTLGGSTSVGNAINSSGVVTGGADTASQVQHAFITNGTSLVDLGTLGGSLSTNIGLGINSAGEVVGSYSLGTSGGPSGAFLDTGSKMVDLNTEDTTSPLALYVTLTSAVGINDNGWIVANGINSLTGLQDAYLLPPSMVPVPGSRSLMVFGVMGLAFFFKEALAGQALPLTPIRSPCACPRWCFARSGPNIGASFPAAKRCGKRLQCLPLALAIFNCCREVKNNSPQRDNAMAAVCNSATEVAA
jgi:probable HAF family extracellular repeat protein